MQQQHLIVHNYALLRVIYLAFLKMHIEVKSSLRFSLFISVAIDSDPLYGDINHFSEGS